MTITIDHRKEAISRAHVAAIAGFAGILTGLNDFDYKVDGVFEAAVEVGGEIGPSGFPLAYQLKSTVKAEWENGSVKYKLKSGNYNYMVGRNTERKATPIILILCCLHDDEPNWVTNTKDLLTLRKCCYWSYLEGTPVPNGNSSKTIKIPDTNILTSDTLAKMMQALQNQEFYENYAT